MVYPDDILGLLQEIRDTLGGDGSGYPANQQGILQEIRDLLGGTGAGGYTADINGLLEEIRDLLNTEDASFDSYPSGQFGLWQAIRDLSNADDDPVTSYPGEITGLIQATRDFIIANPPRGNTAPHDLAFDANAINPAFLVDPHTVSLTVDDWPGPFGSFPPKAIDDEGGVLVYSIVAGLPSLYFVDVDGQITTTATPWVEGNYVFTIRATDNHGLYVEEQFTVTVTA